MEQVSESTEEDRKREWAERQVIHVARHMAINLLRVVRGAGRPHQIYVDAKEFARAAEAYFEAFGMWPVEQLYQAFDLSPEYEITDPLREDVEHATLSIIAGALQTAASRMAGQRSQEAAGMREMLDGIKYRKEAQEAHNADVRKRYPDGAGLAAITAAKLKAAKK